MSTDLENYIKSLKIKMFHLNNGQVIIGKIVNQTIDTIELKSAFSIEPFMTQHGTIMKRLTPLVPDTLDAKHILNVSHISINSDVSLSLKKTYTDILMALALQKIKSKESSNSESNSPNITNPFEDRWS